MSLRHVKLSLGLALVALACSKEQAKTASDVTVRVADAVCKEELSQPDPPDWVKIACPAEAAAGTVVHVLLPRAEWDAARGKKAPPCKVDAGAPAFDAGPGK